VCAGAHVLFHASRCSDKHFPLLADDRAVKNRSAFVQALGPSLAGLLERLKLCSEPLRSRV